MVGAFCLINAIFYSIANILKPDTRFWRREQRFTSRFVTQIDVMMDAQIQILWFSELILDLPLAPCRTWAKVFVRSRRAADRKTPDEGRQNG